MDRRQFLVRRDRLADHDVVTTPRDALAPDTVELRVDRFGFTTNNVTYGVLGDALSYWQFFPSPRADWGCLPVWGFGTVERSAVDGVAVGERCYGYYPMASHVVVQPRRLDEVGFVDGAPHRRALNGVYNQYLRTTRDPSYAPDTEPEQVILRPLFATSYFLADHLYEHDAFGADALLISSASSKLAYGLAFVLATDARRAGRPIIGLTSPGNAAFVTRLGLYDRVVTYDDLAALPIQRAALVDIAGSASVRAAVRARLGDALVHTLAVGVTSGEVPRPSGDEPALFFAPAWIRQRSQQWGAAVVQERLGAAWRAFLVPIRDPARGWMTITTATGIAAVGQVYDQVVAGRARPEHGYVLSLIDDVPAAE